MRCVPLSWAIFLLALSLAASFTCGLDAAEPMRVAAFRCNATPPLGEPLISVDRLGMVEQPLLAKGIILESEGRRYVLCVIDWCELNNGSHDDYVNRVAAAAGTEPAYVAVQTVHQHTAPLVDMDAQRLLADAGYAHLEMSPKAFDVIGQRLEAAVKDAVARLEPCDRIGVGQAKVDRVASSRRPVDASGKIAVRYSSCTDPAIIALPEGTYDPYLKTITFARGDRPLVRLHYYATHPQTYYGDGRATSDMAGDARESLESKEGVPQIYFNGCGGDVTMGKYNAGTKEDRAAMASRTLAGMEAAIAATKFEPTGQIQWRTFPLQLPRRNDAGFSPDDCVAQLKSPTTDPVWRIIAGVRLTLHRRSQQPIQLNALQIGKVHIVHLPGEPMIEFQLFAQSLKPDDFVAVAGYGDCATGYLCPAKAFTEGGYEPTATNVAPEGESLVKKAIAALLGEDSQ